MKKCWLWLLVCVMLSGCGKQEVFEQMGDVYQVMAPQAGVLSLDIPEGAAMTAMGSGPDHGIYFCDGYTMTVQTLPGGDLRRTLRELTGFDSQMPALLQTRDGAVKRYEGAWSCAGESGDQVGRLVLLDDGVFHYAVTVMAPAERVSQVIPAWDTVLGSVNLNHTGS